MRDAHNSVYRVRQHLRARINSLQYLPEDKLIKVAGTPVPSCINIG
jgi:hypothetical protein